MQDPVGERREAPSLERLRAGRSRVVDPAQRGQVGGGQVGVVEDPGEVGRDHEGRGDPFPLDRPQRRTGAEAGLHDHTSAGVEGVEGVAVWPGVEQVGAHEVHAVGAAGLASASSCAHARPSVGPRRPDQTASYSSAAGTRQQV